MPSRLSSRLASALQWGVLIALSAGIAAFLLWIHAPAALMLGPLIAGIVVASSGAKVRFPLPPFVLAQGMLPPALLRKAVMEDFVPSQR